VNDSLRRDKKESADADFLSKCLTGANAALLCYDITSASSFTEMGHWLLELRANLPDDTILHVVGTKADIVAENPSLRKVPLERCIAYVAENLYPASATHTPHQQLRDPLGASSSAAAAGGGRGSSLAVGSPQSERSSMNFWGQDLGWDCCHEVSASTGEGVEEVFRVITRRLVEQRSARAALEARLLEEMSGGRTPGVDEYGNPIAEMGEGGGYANGPHAGSFRVGIGDKRRSWLGLSQFPGSAAAEQVEENGAVVRRKKGPCCT
jgi:GTPase SAR1 family protein